MSMYNVGPIKSFQDSHRFVLNWRSYRNPHLHTAILIYRFSTPPLEYDSDDSDPVVKYTKKVKYQDQKWFAIVNECPHLGAPLEQGEIDIEDLAEGEEENEIPEAIILCPWHQYDFSLKDGQSSTGMHACVYKVEVKENSLWVEVPGDVGEDWRLLGVRPVSEKFAEIAAPEPIQTLDLQSPPKTLVSFCRLILMTADPVQKVSLTRTLVNLWRNGSLQKISSPSDLPPPETPPQPAGTVNVEPGRAGKLGKSGTIETRVRMLHALAVIELHAINLALDAICRFADWKVGSLDGKTGKKLPLSFFSDFLKVAEDESKHHTILVDRMFELNGTKFGQFSSHASLWESAVETKESLFSRLAIINLVHESRGLDTNPKQIARCKSAGDKVTAASLELIHQDEVTHVAVGHRHFQFLCANLNPPLDPIKQFHEEVREHFYGSLKGPYNATDRAKAGFTAEWYEGVKGRAYGAELEAEELAAKEMEKLSVT